VAVIRQLCAERVLRFLSSLLCTFLKLAVSFVRYSEYIFKNNKILIIGKMIKVCVWNLGKKAQRHVSVTFTCFLLLWQEIRQ
jgi:hypothetical protein